MHVYSTLIGGLIAGSTSAKLCKNMKKRPCKKDNLCKWAKGTGTCAFKDEKKLRKTRIIAEGAASVAPEDCEASNEAAYNKGVASVTESPTESPTEPPTHDLTELCAGQWGTGGTGCSSMGYYEYETYCDETSDFCQTEYGEYMTDATGYGYGCYCCGGKSCPEPVEPEPDCCDACCDYRNCEMALYPCDCEYPCDPDDAGGYPLWCRAERQECVSTRCFEDCCAGKNRGGDGGWNNEPLCNGYPENGDVDPADCPMGTYIVKTGWLGEPSKRCNPPGMDCWPRCA